MKTLLYQFKRMKVKIIKRYVNDIYFNAIKTHDHKKLNYVIACFPRIIKFKNSLGLTGLMQAVASRNYEAITYLLGKGIDANVMDRDGWTAKAWAVLLNDLESMKRLTGLSILSDSSGLVILSIGSKHL